MFLRNLSGGPKSIERGRIQIIVDLARGAIEGRGGVVILEGIPTQTKERKTGVIKERLL